MELLTLSSRVILPAVYSLVLLLLLLLLVYRIFTLSVYIGMYTDNRFGQGLAIAALRDWTETPA